MSFILDDDLERIKAAQAAGESTFRHNEIRKITEKAIGRLPQYQQDILYQAMNYFFMLGAHDEMAQDQCKKNKMTPYNIAIVVGPTLYQSSVPTAITLTAKQCLEVIERLNSLPPLVEQIILSWGMHSSTQSIYSAGLISLSSSFESISLDSASATEEEENQYAEIDPNNEEHLFDYQCSGTATHNLLI